LLPTIDRVRFLLVLIVVAAVSVVLVGCSGVWDEVTSAPDVKPTVVVIGGGPPSTVAPTSATSATPVPMATATPTPTPVAIVSKRSPTAAPTPIPPTPTPAPTLAPTPPPPQPVAATATAGPTVAAVDVHVVALVTADELNVRDQPSLESGAIVDVVYEGDDIELTGAVSESSVEGSWRQTIDGNWVFQEWLGRGAFADIRHVGTAIVIPEDGLNVRDAPNLEVSTVVYVVEGGSVVTMTGDTQIVGTVVWRELDDGNWVQGRYLQIAVA